ncbi:TraK family protein [Thalassospira mesophila]|uniref:Conjugal transfer protein TraK n=1 Tax=Thalassospira mesophila TaxID=1293891 RepID=A0A1Y2KUZ1_9PROT|nr:TraK family protein [Thalassospira mesophila]OSQ35132.1 hypothetical protein TMES_21670 [Thalassospira mesophila]
MLEWGIGRVEALAVQSEILTLLDQGYPVSRIYRDMKKSGQITMGRAAFYQHVSKIKRDRLKTDAPTTSKRRPASKPKTQAITTSTGSAGSRIDGRFDLIKKTDEEMWGGNF